MGPGELFEYHMQHLFEDWVDGLYAGDFTEDDLKGFASSVGGWLWPEFEFWAEQQN